MRHYGVTDDGKRVLLRITCDAPGCEASIRPNPKIGESGWIKYGIMTGDFRQEFAYCPEHTVGLAQR